MKRWLPALWVSALYGGWLGAWLLFRFLEPRWPALATLLGATAWWTVARLVIWIGPALVFSRLIPLSPGALRLGHLRRVPLALALGGLWVLLNVAGDALLHRTPTPAMDAGVLSACLVAPFAEELVFRGFAFAWLEQRSVGFWRANLSCALLFAALHLPGWVFMQGVGVQLPAQFAQTALLGFGFGLIRGKDGSLWAPIAVHFANNAWSTGLISWLLR